MDATKLFIAAWMVSTVTAPMQKKGPLVTNLVFFDVDIDGIPSGRIIFGLFGDIVPKTVENFLRLAIHDKGYGYKGSRFRLIKKSYNIVGGAFHIGNQSSGRSWFGADFEPENFELKHYGPGWVSMASVAKRWIGSQFYIITDELYGMRAWFDGRYVVFAAVVHGMDLVHRIEGVETFGLVPVKPVIVTNCGTLKLEKPFVVEKDYILEDIVSIYGKELWVD